MITELICGTRIGERFNGIRLVGGTHCNRFNGATPIEGDSFFLCHGSVPLSRVNRNSHVSVDRVRTYENTGSINGI